MTTVARFRPRLLRGLPPVLTASCAVTAIAALSAPAAHAAVPAATVHAGATAQPATPGAGEWWLAAVHAPAGQAAAGHPGRGVTVAVLSTGVDAGHPDLTGAVTTGPDLGRTGRTAGGPYWGEEGTAAASLIAGHGHGPGGAEGVTGIAPGTRILSVPVTLEFNDPLNSDAAVAGRLPAAIAAGIRYAVGHGASVIALPLDPGTFGSSAAGGSAAERSAVGYALAHNVLLVAPSGDNGAKGDAANYPASYPGVIAVGATVRNGSLAPFSNAGPYVALTAPGSDTTPGGFTAAAHGLTVAAPGGQYQSLASSDMSAALAAGVAALIRARYPGLTVPEVTRALERGTTAPPKAAGQPAPPGWGHGALNATAALAAAAATAAAHPAPSPSATASPTARPVITSGHSLAAPVPRRDPGHLLRSLVVGLAIAAGVLIACLTGALATVRVRRRERTRLSRPVHPRHARGQRADPSEPRVTRLVLWPPGQAAPQDQPPWAPADPPGRPVNPDAFLPSPAEARTAAGGDSFTALAGHAPTADWKPVAPWERDPAEFATARPHDQAPGWPASSTGPMYVWNPAATTGPLSIAGGQGTAIEGEGEDQPVGGD